MTNNAMVINNIKSMASSIMSYRSYFNSPKDIYGEVDEAAQDAERALLHLADVMSRLDDEVVIMTTHNAHNPELVKHINLAYSKATIRRFFGIILLSIVHRDIDEAKEKLLYIPQTTQEASEGGMPTEILENICDDEDLRMILSFVGYTRHIQK